MSAEPRQATSTEAWTKWQNQIVEGRFALRRCLGWTDHSAVFLTEHKARNLAEAAIKFVRADAPEAQALLLRWQAAINLSDPHLVQLFEVGRYESGGHDYQFVVMEYADQTLEEILRRRPLNAEEVQELLPPVLDALTFLHRRQLVQSQLKPSNFLAVGDQLKLASDTIRPAGQDHGTSTAGDVWSFGATLVEALTARPRISIEQRFDVSSLPAGLPATLVDTVQRCLSPSPADRPSIIELRSENKPAAAPVAPVAKPEPPKQKGSQEVVAPSRPADIASRVAALAQPAPNTSREIVPPRPAPPASQEAARSQPMQAAPRVAAPSQPTNTDSREVARPPAHAAPRVASQPRTVPSSSQGLTPPKPASTVSREVAAPQAARTDSQVAAPTQPVPATPREVAPLQFVQTASNVTVSFHAVSAAPPQPAPSTSREVASPQPAYTAPRVAAPAQRAPSTARDITPPQSTASASREVARPQPVSDASGETPPSERAPKRLLSVLGIAAGAVLLVIAVWIGLRSTGDSPTPLQPAAIPAPMPPAPAKVATTKPSLSTPVSPPPAQPAPSSTSSSSVLHEVTPTVPAKIQSKIQGRVYVTVRVLVDPVGNVTAVLMENAGPSKYFARLTDQAAREWQFVPADTDAARVWLLRFEYTRSGVAVRTIEQ